MRQPALAWWPWHITPNKVTIERDMQSEQIPPAILCSTKSFLGRRNKNESRFSEGNEKKKLYLIWNFGKDQRIHLLLCRGVCVLYFTGVASGREPYGFIPHDVRHRGHTATEGRLPGRREHQRDAAQHSQAIRQVASA